MTVRMEAQVRERVCVSESERVRVFILFYIYIYIYGSGMDNIHTLPDYVLPIKNRVLPKTFGSGRVRYPLPNGYGHPYVGCCRIM